MGSLRTSDLHLAGGALHRAVATMVAVLTVISTVALAANGGSAALGSQTQSTGIAPQLSNPITIRLKRGGTTTYLDRGKDYVIKLPKGQKRGHTAIVGGRNVVIDGGHIVMKGQGGSEIKRRALYIKDATGTVRIENVLIQGKKRAAFDAIAISAPKAVVQLVNVRVVGLHGRVKGFHGDIVQPFGGVKRLVVDGLTGRSSYQGFYLVETGGKIGSVELRNVDLRYLRNPHDRTTFLLWLDGCSTYPVTLRNVYIKPRNGQRVASQAVQPDAGSGRCPALQNGKTVSWPRAKAIDGTVTEGTPAGGAFVAARPRR